MSRFNLFFTCGYSIVLAPFVEKTIFCPLDFLYSFVEDQKTRKLGLYGAIPVVGSFLFLDLFVYIFILSGLPWLHFISDFEYSFFFFVSLTKDLPILFIFFSINQLLALLIFSIVFIVSISCISALTFAACYTSPSNSLNGKIIFIDFWINNQATSIKIKHV